MILLERIELYWYKQLQLKGKEHVESILVCNKIDLFQENCDEDYQRIFFKRTEHFASSYDMSVYYISAIRGDNIQAMIKQLILRILRNESLLRSVKNNPKIYDTSPNKKESGRASIQVSIQSSANNRNSSGDCCKSA